MRWSQWFRVAILGLGIWGTGCTSLRELPRSDYATRPERQHVRLVTTDGLVYEFDYVSVEGDSLVGYRHRELEGPLEEYASLGFPMEAIARLSVRSVNWYRTGVVGGSVVAAIVAKGLSNANSGSPAAPGGGGGKGGGIP